MFRKDRYEPIEAAIPETTTAETVIREGTVIDGTITSSIALRLDGSVRGEIKSQGSVTVGGTGKLIGNITARELLISGAIEGNAFVDERTEFTQGGYLRGDLSTGSLIIADGAAFDGTCQMRTETAPAAPEYSYAETETVEVETESVFDSSAL